MKNKTMEPWSPDQCAIHDEINLSSMTITGKIHATVFSIEVVRKAMFKIIGRAW